MQINKVQFNDGVKCVWNTMAGSTQIQQKISIPQAIHYTPMCPLQFKQFNKLPLQCQYCASIMNCFCQIENNSRIKCSICNNYTNLPTQYRYSLNESLIPKQLTSQFTTFQYIKPLKGIKRMSNKGYLFVIDTAINNQELSAIKSTLIKIVNQLSLNDRIGLITYNKYIILEDFGCQLDTSYCFTPDQQIINGTNLCAYLAIDMNHSKEIVMDRFFIKISENNQKFIDRISYLKSQLNNTKKSRALRASGQALNIAVNLLQLSHESIRLVFLCGGPCNIGPGRILTNEMNVPTRSMYTVFPQTSQKAIDFYTNLGKKLVNSRIIVDMFIFSFEEVGFMEMSGMLQISGGLIVMHEKFQHSVFKQTIQKAYIGCKQNSQNGINNNHDKNINQIYENHDNALQLGRNAFLIVKCSKQIKINSMLGQCYPLPRSVIRELQNIQNKYINVGDASIWYLGSLDPYKTLTLILELNKKFQNPSQFYIQFITKYINQSYGNYQIVRVTTIRRQIHSQISNIVKGFDQQAAIVLLAKLSIRKSIKLKKTKIRQQLDTILFNCCKFVGKYNKYDQKSFILPQEMILLPQYVYNLRRNIVISHKNASLDQIYYMSYLMSHENVKNTLLMIQSALLSYSQEEVKAVSLDIAELKSDVVLLLDTYFNIVQWLGANRYQQFKQIQKRFQQEKNNNIEQEISQQKIFNKVKNNINMIIKQRFPIPNILLTYPKHSYQRYLKSKIIIRSQQYQQLRQEQQNNFYDESINLQNFISELIKIIVNKNQ